MYRKLMFFAVVAGFFAAQVSGCATPDRMHLPGSIMLDVGHEGWVVAEDGKVSSAKTGKGTQSSILGWICTGDSSIEASRKQGEITRVSHVDYHSSSLLGLIGDCTLICYGD